MTGRNIISRELADSIRQCLGRKVKLTLRVIVKSEIKTDKLENRVLGFSTCRLFVLTTKVPTRVDQHFHYLDIQSIESRKPNQLLLTVGDRSYVFYTIVGDDPSSSHEVDTMILNLATALKNIFPAVPIKHIIRKIDLQPVKRLQSIDDLERATLGGTSHMGPCGGFSDQYACMCDYHGLPYRAEVAWDVDTIYLSHDTREIYLHDFDYLEQKDLIPIISALEYNMWFRKFRASHSKLSHEASERILHLIGKSLSLEEIYMDNIGAKIDFANKFSLSLLSNSNIPLQKLDISHNPIEDKGAVHLSNPIGRQSKGLSHLNLANCSLTSKGVNMIAHSLSVNKYMCQTLTYLSLAGNSLKDEVNNLYNFLAQPNVLKTLDLSATECAIDAVFGALLRGCTSCLSHLNLSRSVFSSKKSKEMLPSFKQYFTSTLSLKNFNLSQCKLPVDALKNVLLGLACNENISDVELDLSCNQLGPTGAQILESCIHGIRCLCTLDISDNGLESQLGPVVLAVSKNKSIKKLSLGRNLNNIKSKHVPPVMEAIVHLIQEEDCVLETLLLNDSRLKSDLHTFLNALGSNRCVKSLDISGNYMGDSGARLLAKALQINSKLQYINYDRNNITLMGYSDIGYALQSNYSMKFLPFPIHDATLCMKTAPDRTENIMRKIQDMLYRNVAPMKYSHGQAFRLQQGFLLSSNQHQVDRLVLQTGELSRTLKRTASTSKLADRSSVGSMLDWSDSVVSDAEKSKQLISHLHDVVLRRDETGNPIETKLHQISKDLHSVIKNYIQDTVESMVRSAQDRCPNVLNEEKAVDDIRAACSSKSTISQQFVDQALVEQAGSVILNKVNEVNLSVASTVSDRVIDEVVDSLSKACKNMQTGEAPRKRASTGLELESPRERDSSESSSRSERSPPEMDPNTPEDEGSLKSEPATPQLASKRKSLHGRKLRPQSVVAESLDSVSDLPSTTSQLSHLGKNRPKRPKTRAPTRPLGKAEVLEEGHDISQGVETFFRPGSATPNTTPLVSPESEMSPLLKCGSSSSMDSFPHTSNEKGSADSLSDSAARSESDSTAQDSPNLHSRLTDGEKEDYEEERRSVSSLVGRLSSDSGLRLSPDIGYRKSTICEEENSSSSNTKKSGSILSKFGRSMGGNVLAEMKAVQEKRSSILNKDDDKQDESSQSHSKSGSGAKSPIASGILGGVKLRPTGLKDSMKSPTNGFSRGKSPPLGKRDSTADDGSQGGSPKPPIILGMKVKPPPPLAPKPRPKSSFTPDGKLGFETDQSEEDASPSPPRSVKELAASLAVKGSKSSSAALQQSDDKKKSSSLPRNSGPVAGAAQNQSPLSLSYQRVEDITERAADGETLCNESRITSNVLQRQTSQKHLLTAELTIEDVIDV